jgi:hypothetical protein
MMNQIILNGANHIRCFFQIYVCFFFEEHKSMYVDYMNGHMVFLKKNTCGVIRYCSKLGSLCGSFIRRCY